MSSLAEWSGRQKGQMLRPEMQSRTSTNRQCVLGQACINPTHPQHAINPWSNLATFPVTTKALGPEADPTPFCSCDHSLSFTVNKHVLCHYSRDCSILAAKLFTQPTPAMPRFAPFDTSLLCLLT